MGSLCRASTRFPFSIFYRHHPRLLDFAVLSFLNGRGPSAFFDWSLRCTLRSDFHEIHTVTSTVDSVIPASVTDPTAFVNSANSSARSGVSFADVCAAHLAPAPESQSTTSTPAVPSSSSPQTGTIATPSNAPGAKGTTKNAPTAGSNPAVTFLVSLSPIPLPIPVDALPCAPPQIASLTSVNSADQTDSASDGAIQTASLTAAPGLTTGPVLAHGNTKVPSIATPIPSLPPSADPSPKESAASALARSPWFFSPPIETNPAASSASTGSPPVLPNGMGAQGPTVENMPTAAPDGQTPSEIIPATRETLGQSAEMSCQAPVAATASEIPSFSLDAQPPSTPGQAEQLSQDQPPATQVSPAVVETHSPPAASPENVSQVAATSSSQPEQNAPADQKAQPRSVTQPRSPLDRESSRPSSAPATSSASSAGTETSLASHAALQGTQPAPSAVRLSAPAHGTSSSAPAIQAAASQQTANHQSMPTEENGWAVPMKSNPGSSPAWECTGQHFNRPGSGDQRGFTIERFTIKQ